MNETDREIPVDDDPILTRASQWLVARDRGLTAADLVEFERWKNADLRHATAYAEMEEAWAIMADAPAPPLAAVPVLARRRRLRRWMPWAAAVAAAVAFGYFGWWQPRHGAFEALAATEVGGSRQLALPDGSVIQLNTDTELAVHYRFGERRVNLMRGEAHFTVAKNAARPFYVHAQGIDVRAVGTAFNVRLRADSVDVLVTEGKVRLERPVELPTGGAMTVPVPVPALAFLAAGEKASITLTTPTATAPAPVAVQPVGRDVMDQALAWRGHQLQFSTETLAEMVAEFNRYNRHQIEIADPKLVGVRFGGTFPADDYAGFVQLLEKEFGVTAERHPDRTLLRRAP